MLETLSVIGTIILIIIGVLIITLLVFVLRILMVIYGFFNSKGVNQGEGLPSSLGRFIKGASVIEIILFLIKNRGRFRR